MTRDVSVAVAVASAAAFLSLAPIVAADKDSDYLPPGLSDPLTSQRMYWRDAVNVLQDLSQFESLYVKYHGCVWSQYGYEGYGEIDEDGAAHGCGGAGYDGGDRYWYLGRTQCFRANVAYSLYGVLRDDDGGGGATTDGSGSYCHKSTYINSFFTTYGVESFGGPLGMDTDTANSKCYSTEPGDDGDDVYANGDDDNGDDDGNNNDDGNNDDAGDDALINYAAYTSYGTGCSASGHFVIDMYKGAFCHGQKYLKTLHTLDNFNKIMRSMTCEQIYRHSQGGRDLLGEEVGGRIEHRRRAEDNNNNNDFDSDFEDMDPIDILKYSRSCSVRQNPEDCPDPYGVKARYDRVADRAVRRYKRSDVTWAELTQKAVWASSSALLLGGVLLIFLAQRRKDVALRKEKKRMRAERELENGKASDDGSDDGSDGGAPFEFQILRSMSSVSQRVASVVSERAGEVARAVRDYAEETTEDVDGGYVTMNDDEGGTDDGAEDGAASRGYRSPSETAETTPPEGGSPAKRTGTAPNTPEPVGASSPPSALAATTTTASPRTTRPSTPASPPSPTGLVSDEEEEEKVDNAEAADAVLASMGAIGSSSPRAAAAGAGAGSPRGASSGSAAGLTSPSSAAAAPPSGKKYKRPFLARVSKRVLGRKTKKRESSEI